MKNTITLLICLLISISSFAQQGINYKAIIKDDLGNVIASEPIQIQFNILKGVAQSNEYSEWHGITTDANGIIIVNIGEGNLVTGSPAFNTLDWASDTHFLEVELNLSGSGITNLGITEFKAVPYAKTAEVAENVFSGDYNDLTNQPTTLPTGLEKVTDSINSDTGLPIYGWRLIGADPNDYGNIGKNAVDLSYSTGNITLFGLTGATGGSSFAAGINSTASGSFSTVMGLQSSASGFVSTALGHNTSASGSSSMAMGFLTLASGDYSTTMGSTNLASGDYSTAMGRLTQASGSYSTAMGNGTYASNNGSLSIGIYNLDVPTGLFMVGNGESVANDDPIRRNALTVLENGNVGIGRHNPSSLLEVAHLNSPPTTSNYKNAFGIHNIITGASWQLSTVSAGHLNLYKNGSYRGFFNQTSGAYTQFSDRRLKKDITSIEDGTLNKVMQLNPVSYLVKDQTDSKRNLGLISQEVKEIFPSITHYVEEQDLLALSYTELIPILIKALQEQQTIIETQKAKDIVQDNSIEELSARLNQLEADQTN